MLGKMEEIKEFSRNKMLICKSLLVNGNRCRNEVRISGYCIVHYQKKYKKYFEKKT